MILETKKNKVKVVMNTTKTMPMDIFNNDLDFWIDDIIGHFEDMISISLSYDFFRSIKIEFSDDKKISQYKKNKYTLDEIKDIFLKKWPSMEDWAKNKINNCETKKELRYWIDGTDDIVAIISKTNNISIENIREFFDEIYNETSNEINYIVGEYIDIESKIVLYSQVIEESNYCHKDYYFDVLAHEMFHAIHYSFFLRVISNDINNTFLDTEMPKRNDYTAKVVAESLATYFEYDFCKGKNKPELNDIIYDLEKDLNNSLITNYPYCGALELISNGLNFMDVLKISLTDMDSALRKLLGNCLDDFYNIKNKTSNC